MSSAVAIALHSPGSPSGLAAFIRAIPPVPRAIGAAALVCAVVAAAAWQGGWLLPTTEVFVPLVGARDARVEARAQARRRCDNCGVVESIRRVEPAAYEFTVRMRDGTARTSSDASASKWRAGDHVMLIGGDANNH